MDRSRDSAQASCDRRMGTNPAGVAQTPSFKSFTTRLKRRPIAGDPQRYCVSRAACSRSRSIAREGILVVVLATLVVTACGCMRNAGFPMQVSAQRLVRYSDMGRTSGDTHAADSATSATSNTKRDVVPAGGFFGEIEDGPPLPPLPDTDDVEGVPAERGDVPLELVEAVARAIQRNPELNVQRFSPQIAGHQVILADSIFDPTLQFGGQWSENTSQIANITNGPGLGVTSQTVEQFAIPTGLADHVRLSKQLRTGGELTGGLTTDYTRTSPDGGFLAFNPAIRSRLTFEYTQPLLRNAGHYQATIDVRLAYEASAAARLGLASALQEVVTRTITSYWTLAQAQTRVASAQQAVDEAVMLLTHEREKLELGASTDVDVADAAAQVEAFRINLTIAQENERVSQAELCLLLGESASTGCRYVVATEPTAVPPPEAWEPLLSDALAIRPDARLQQTIVRSADLQHHAAGNLLLPELDAYAGWGLAGLGDDFDEAWRNLGTADFQNWWVGLRFEQPLGNRAARSQHAQAWLTAAQARASLQQVHASIESELRIAHDRLISSWRIVSLSRKRVEAAKVVLDARKDMRSLQSIPVQDYLIALENWRQADEAARAALYDYSSRFTAWERARGRILDYASVSISGDPRPW